MIADWKRLKKKKKKRRKAGRVVVKPLDNFETLYEKDCIIIMIIIIIIIIIIIDQTHVPGDRGHFFNSRPSNRNGSFLITL